MISISAGSTAVSENATTSVVSDENHSYQAIETILNSLDALVYVSDMQTYDLLYINDYGAAEWGPIAGRKCFQVLQAGQLPRNLDVDTGQMTQRDVAVPCFFVPPVAGDEVALPVDRGVPFPDLPPNTLRFLQVGAVDAASDWTKGWTVGLTQ